MDSFLIFLTIVLIYILANVGDWIEKISEPRKTDAEARRLSAKARLIEAETARDAARK